MMMITDELEMDTNHNEIIKSRLDNIDIVRVFQYNKFRSEFQINYSSNGYIYIIDGFEIINLLNYDILILKDVTLHKINNF